VGIRNLDKAVDLAAWDEAGLFGTIAEVTVAIGLAKPNAYLLPGDAKTTVAAEIIEPWRRTPCPCSRCVREGALKVEFSTLEDALQHEGTPKPNRWP
jgi:hypothetical protein